MLTQDNEEWYNGYRPSGLIITASVLISFWIAGIVTTWVLNLLWPPVMLAEQPQPSDIAVNALFLLLWSLLLGLCSGLGQTIIQRRSWPDISAGRWISAHILGAIAGSTWIIIVLSFSPQLPGWVLLMATCIPFSAIASGIQWLVLRHQLTQSAPWVGLNMFIWMISLGIGGSIFHAMSLTISAGSSF